MAYKLSNIRIMIKSNKFLSVFILSVALSFSACSGGETNNNQQTVNVENNSSIAESDPATSIDISAATNSNADQLAQNFILEAGDMRELFGIFSGVWDVYVPSGLCFNYWNKRGEYSPTKEQKNNCTLWVQEVADLYASYGYVTKPDTFKSELFWSSIEKWGEENYKDERIKARENKTVGPDCPSRPQKNYRTPELIEDGTKPDYCKKYERQ